jgi:CRISPR system Cascade subunit CasB
MNMGTEKEDLSRAEAFVAAALNRMYGKKPDSAFRAAFSRADNPDLDYRCWEYLLRWRCNITDSKERRAFTLIGAALARMKEKQTDDGKIVIGQAIARCYDDEGMRNGSEKDSAMSKFRRILACRSTEEACDILRPILRLIDSRGIRLKYTDLLKNLLSSDYGFNEWVKPRWARDFYTFSSKDDKGSKDAETEGER